MRFLAASLVLWLLTSTLGWAAPYPGTCFPDRAQPLPAPAANEPVIFSGSIDLLSPDKSGNTSTYNYSVYRRACPGGGAAVLIAFSGGTTGVFPLIRLVQGTTAVTAIYNAEAYTNLLAINTVTSDVGTGSIVVLDTYGIDYTKALSVQMTGTSPSAGGTRQIVNLPDFNPAQYPDLAKGVPIAGYVAGLYYDPAHSGEGVEIEVIPGQVLTVTMYTFDDSGNPLWLTGAAGLCQSCFSHQTYSSTVTMLATKGGGFGGTTDPTKVTKTVWGTIQLSWPSCGTVSLVLTATNNDPTLPKRSATLSWSRLTSVEYANCVAQTAPG
jgi:hypothetical protein